MASPWPPGRGPKTNETLFEILRLLGTASLVLGRIYEGHVNALRLVACYATTDIAAQMADDAAAGHLFAVWVAPSPDPVRVLRLQHGYRIIGTKEFCSAAGHATRAVITARDELGNERLLWVDARKAIVEPKQAWQMHGMRSAITRPVRFNMEVAASPMIGEAGDYLREPEFSGGAWRTSVVTVGGLEGLVTEAIAQLRARDRHIDPHQSARIGEMLIASQTARMWGIRAANTAAATGLSPEAVRALVNLARVAIERCCLDVIILVQRSLGLRALLTANPVEGMIRNLTIYLRQPAADEALTEAARWFAENGGLAGDDPSTDSSLPAGLTGDM